MNIHRETVRGGHNPAAQDGNTGTGAAPAFRRRSCASPDRLHRQPPIRRPPIGVRLPRPPAAQVAEPAFLRALRQTVGVRPDQQPGQSRRQIVVALDRRPCRRRLGDDAKPFSLNERIARRSKKRPIVKTERVIKKNKIIFTTSGESIILRKSNIHKILNLLWL